MTSERTKFTCNISSDLHFRLKVRAAENREKMIDMVERALYRELGTANGNGGSTKVPAGSKAKSKSR